MVLVTKTLAGRRELQERAFALNRTSRTLLVLADGVRTQEELLQFVRGAELGDIEALRVAGLVTLSAGGAPVAGRSASAPGPGQAPRSASMPLLDETLNKAVERSKPVAAMEYQELYATLNLLCRDHLGLIKGFRYSMEIEKASNVTELRDLARRFVEDVEQSKGPIAGQVVRRALALD